MKGKTILLFKELKSENFMSVVFFFFFIYFLFIFFGNRITQHTAHRLEADPRGSQRIPPCVHIGQPLCSVAQSCRLCDPMDCSPPGSSVRGIPQAGLLEWVAISFSSL